jgi:hypothetical protein
MLRQTLLLLTITASGCLGSALSNDPNAGGNTDPGGGSSSGATDDMGVDATAEFFANVAPILKAACAGCHGVTGTSAPAFLVNTPDMLTTLLAYPTIIGDSPETSRLYAKGVHEGPAFTPTEAPIIGDWITLYNSTKQASATGGGDGGAAAAAPSIKPFAPSMTGLNTIDLSTLDPKYAGMKITFNAKMIGSSIQLSAITVAAAPTMGVHVTHPIFVSWDQNLTPIPDPVDSFSNLDQTVYQTQTAPLGPGTLVLPNFAAGNLLNVVFTAIDTKSGDAGTTTVACKALAMFTANVKPLLASGGCSTNCHVGATPQSMLNFATTPDAALCVLVLSEVDKTTPANSQMLLQPDPAKANGHPQKVNPFTNFQTAVTNWINAEK